MTGAAPRHPPSLTALMTAGAMVGLAIAASIPLIAVQMEHAGFSAGVIGVNSAMGPIGVMLISPFIPRLTARFGAVRMMLAGLGGMALAFCAFTYVPVGYGWFALRFCLGLCAAFVWIISESWVNALVSDEKRGRILAFYGLSISLGFVAGPLIPKLAGVEGGLPFLISGAVLLGGLIPLYLVRGERPVISSKEKPNFPLLVKSAPAVFAAALLAGLLDTVALTFLPVYGLRQGLDADAALLITIVFLSGGLLFQLPIGWLADHVDRRRLLTAAGAACVAGPALLGLSFDDETSRVIVLTLWGAVAGSVYMLGVTLLGQRFEARDLIAANAAFVVSFQIANIAGPPAAGFAMERLGPNGLLWFLGAVSAVFVLAGVFRSVKSR